MLGLNFKPTLRIVALLILLSSLTPLSIFQGRIWIFILVFIGLDNLIAFFCNKK